ncbi:fimbrial family protein [Collimonas arenae]|uniref:Fimbrial family protein n=1 Tax=Collimonas arenae TaxID=279058 RepID=A0A127QKH6_9BURK|nr:fimbrial protein [Collimonas arenae]AMP00670.1 fimbrial family protein [Collimonas arenae]AMP10558.1 fimbrial family protein [Collimonas arenae]
MEKLTKKIIGIGGYLAWIALSAAALLGASGAQAACVRPAGAVEKIIQMDMGTVVIPNNAAVGAVFATKSFTIPIAGASETSWICSGGGYVTGSILQGSPVAGMPNVYTTAVTGVGIRLSRQITGIGQTYYPHVINIANGNAVFLSPSYFTVELIKTATKTGNGPLAAGTYTTYVGNGDNKSAITSILSGNGITIITPSCTVDTGSQNVVVNFGSISRGSFKGIGSTAGDRPFNIKLNCQRGENAQNTILLNMQATADLSKSAGVTQLTQSAGVATGVAIQILDKNSQPVIFGTAMTVGPSADIQYVVPFTARYYQTAGTVTTGSANGTATFTVEYQ